MSVKRFENHGDPRLPSGLYVHESDYDALAARLAEAEKDNRDWFTANVPGGWIYAVTRLAEAETLLWQVRDDISSKSLLEDVDAFLTPADQPPDADAEARALFYTTRNGHGWTAPEWDELAEETRQNYRDFAARRAADQPTVRVE